MNKKFYSLAFAAALLGLASCSSDEPAIGGDNGGSLEGESYLAFTISNAGGNSRAATATNTEAAVGSEAEPEVKNIRFYFYDGNKNAFNFEASENVNGQDPGTTPDPNYPGYTNNMVTPMEVDGENDSMGATDRNVYGVLVLGKQISGYVGATPSYVLCVANATEAEFQALAGISLAEALQKTTNWAALNSSSKFLMTSATWVNNGVVTVAADNIQSHVAKTPALATANPIRIFIERLAVKVRANYPASIPVESKVATVTENPDGGTTTTTYTDFVVNGKKAKFNLKINGWQLQKTAVQSNLFKDLKSTYATFTWDWNDAVNHRSFWAETLPGTLANTTYDIYATGNDDKFTLQSYNEDAPTANIAYCYENTTDATNATFKVFDRENTKATAIVVKGTLSMTIGEGTAAQTIENVNLCKWFGNYYTEDELVKLIVDAYNHTYNATKTAADVKWTKNTTNDNTWKAQINKGTAEAPEYVDVTNFESILRWQYGVTSYYLNIEHQTGLPGVVRNHIYDYTFNGVVGLGFPGNDPKTPEDEETFVAAQVNVLNWNIVSNTITLQ